MTSPKRLIMHIGLQKTGTSSIQLMLHKSSAQLQDQGYYFPRMPQAGAAKTWNTAYGHNLIAATFADFSSTFATFSPEQIEDIRSDMLGSQFTPILSAEEFSRQTDMTRWAGFLEGFSVDVVVYLRRQDKFVESLYNQRNKILLTRKSPVLLDEELVTAKGLFKFLESEHYLQLLNYNALVERLMALPFVNRVLVREFERTALVEQDACKDFADLLGMDHGQLSLPQQEANMNVANIYFKKLRTTFMESGEEAALDYLNSMYDRFQGNDKMNGNYGLLTGFERSSFLAQFISGNSKLTEKYGIFKHDTAQKSD